MKRTYPSYQNIAIKVFLFLLFLLSHDVAVSKTEYDDFEVFSGKKINQFSDEINKEVVVSYDSIAEKIHNYATDNRLTVRTMEADLNRLKSIEQKALNIKNRVLASGLGQSQISSFLKPLDETLQKIARAKPVMEKAISDTYNQPYSSNSYSSSTGSGSKYSCSVLCRGSLYATGSRFTMEAWGNSGVQAGETIKAQADKQCEQSAQSSSWWADIDCKAN